MKTPLEKFGELFIALHENQVCEDGKIISDAIPNSSPEEILAVYKQQKDLPGFSLKRFFNTHFAVSKSEASSFESDPTVSAEDHVKSLWPYLKRSADVEEKYSSLIPLPHDYIVPGGRFNEIYYWDSYFTMLGLAVHNEWDTIRSMVKNFSYLIDSIGFIPNGNRTYFLGRSQPPFYSKMVSLLAEKDGDEVYKDCYPYLKQEYKFWMSQPEEKLKNSAYKHSVYLEDQILNRYYDQHERAREEMYHDDFDLLQQTDRTAVDLFSNLRAACESGWDFSSRWCQDKMDLKTIECSDIVPVDLNCLLYQMELTLANASKFSGHAGESETYSWAAKNRAELINTFFWNDELKFYTDYNWVRMSKTISITAAGFFPLYFNIASEEQAASCVKILEDHLMAPGGVLTTNITSGQQWDAPNGWAPLQWMVISGLLNYGYKELALELSQRWVNLCERVYANTGKFVEKYNVVDMQLEAGGGEYAVQDGFGWSNGVYVALKNILDNE